MDNKKTHPHNDEQTNGQSVPSNQENQRSSGAQESGLSNNNQSIHPTGSPEDTGGWYSEVSEINDIPSPSGNQERSQHPTGSPEMTGGWFTGNDNPDQNPKNSKDTDHPQEVYLKEHPSTPRRKTERDHTLPKRVDEIDVEATRVTSSAYKIPKSPYPTQKSKPGKEKIGFKTISEQFSRLAAFLSQKNKPTGCAIQMGIAILFLGVIIFLGVLSFTIFKYFSIASSLPEIDNIQEQASQFETTRILDRNGNLLYELIDPNAGRRTYIPLEDISPYLIAATIATEDQDFYNHPGFDVIAIMRALLQNYLTGETVSGASTITQQLAREILLSPSERNERTVDRKAKEIVLAAEITRMYEKDEILELYLNEIYYGSQAYGIEAAAETYFNTTAERLTLSQASFLAGLPQAPSVYDVFTNPEAAFNRQRDVIILMFQLSQDNDCIEVSNSLQPVCVDATDAAQSIDEITSYSFTPHDYIMNYPHWVNYIRAVLEEQYDSQTIYRSGFTISTTLDPELQNQAEEIVKQHVASLSSNHVSDGALVAIDPASGEILAMVGSADFYNEDISGQINMATSPRQPGSAIKPLTYVAAFEKGWTPSTVLWDVPSEFPPSGDESDIRPRYVPVNYDDQFHGPVLLRSALANSYNIPAVKTLQFVGIYDDPDIPGEDGLISFAKRMGISTLNDETYGLSLTLGGGDVSLLELTNAYGIFANGGKRITPAAITKIVDYLGNTVYEQEPISGEQIVRQEHTFLISSILSDNQARTPMFGVNSALNLPFPAAVKTGTTNDFRDNWTVGYTPDIVIGVWVGNADYTPMMQTTGLSGAAPIWSEFIQYAVKELVDNNPTPFVKPAGVVERTICSVSGAEPSDWCPNEIVEYFANDQLPSSQENDLLINQKIDTWTGFKASDACPDYTKEVLALNIDDPWAIEWLQNTSQGQQWLHDLGVSDSVPFIPQQECKVEDAHPIIEFPGLTEDQWIQSSPIDIYAIVNATQNFSNYHLEYGLGDNPEEWYRLLEHQTVPITQPQNIYAMDVSDLPQGTITIRIILNSTNGTSAEKRLHLYLNVPTKTPTLTPSPTQTIIPSFTPTITMTETPTLTASVVSTP